MVKKVDVPDAWDDDWETQADRVDPEEQNAPEPEQKQQQQTKAARLAQHVADNRKLWESAESPETFHFVEANSNAPPIASAFKPQVKVLSRRPMIAKRDPASGMSQLSLEDDEAENTNKKEGQLSPEEIRAKQKREREEKQRRYDEARAKIFGEPSPSSGASSPGTVTPPRSDGQRTPRGRGRGRGGPSSQRNLDRNNNETSQFDFRRNTQPGPGRELYDPNYSPKLEVSGGRESDPGPPSRISTPRSEQQAIRAPRGPDGSGRGGFGFMRRGGNES